jgi:hypothetical protein
MKRIYRKNFIIIKTDYYKYIIYKMENENDNKLINILNNLIEKTGIQSISKSLNISSSTINRWILLNNVPCEYEFDLLKMKGIKIDYKKYTSKQKNQFFTPIKTAEKCFNIFCDEIKKYNDDFNNYMYIEPSAGDGSFIKTIQNKFKYNNIIGIDIDPKDNNNNQIIKMDFLEWKPTPDILGKKIVIFGNPPFGLRGHKALQFINYSYEFADYVCFILPQLFESDGKGSPRIRVKYNLIYSSKIDNLFYEPDSNKNIKINVIFQIWSKYNINEKYNSFPIKELKNKNIKIYSLSDGGTSSSTRNKNMIDKCDIYIPSTCFGKENMKCYLNFNDLPGKRGYGVVFNTNKDISIKKSLCINLCDYSFLSTNSAYNLRMSIIYNLFDT